MSTLCTLRQAPSVRSVCCPIVFATPRAPAPDYSREASRLILRSSVPDTAGGGRVKGLQEYSFSMDALVNPTCGAVAKNTVPGEGRAVTRAHVRAVCPAITLGARTHRHLVWHASPGARTAALWAYLKGWSDRPACTPIQRGPACVDSFTNLGGAAMDPALLLEYNDISLRPAFWPDPLLSGPAAGVDLGLLPSPPGACSYSSPARLL